MVVLKAIGAFFAKIGRWIKETAWVQPLLIVGCIFGLIFAIPYLINWVTDWFTDGNDATTYYTKYMLDLEGCENGNSDADKFLNDLETLQDAEVKQKYGEKFFLCFVQESCSDCEENYLGYDTIQSNWNKGAFTGLGNEKFKMYTIFVDTENSDDEILFKEYFYSNHFYFFENVAEGYDESYYALNKSSIVTSLGDISDVDLFNTPTSILFDFTADGKNYNELGVGEIFFSVDGSDKYEKALFIRNAWLHQGIFSASYIG